MKFSYVDPKFKIIIGLLSFIIIFACVVGMMYAFGLRFHGDTCYILDPKSKDEPKMIKIEDFLYRPKTRKCFQASGISDDCFGKINRCITWTADGTMQCRNYNATTGLCR